MSPTRPPVIVHHMAALDGRFPPNSLEAVVASLAANADVVELDITALADRDYLLVHDRRLEAETNGGGEVRACSARDAASLRIKWNAQAPDYLVPRLSQVVSVFRQSDARSRLQLDLKNVEPFATDEPLERLIRLIEPLSGRVQVSTNADWQLRRLRALAPWLELGLDVHFYLDVRESASADPTVYPRQRGAYGYWDDHPLARRRYWPTATYLADRVASLIGLVPNLSTFYVSHHLLVRSLDDDFNWATLLHERDVRLDAWTLDVTSSLAAANAIRLFAAGVDQFTTNTPHELRELLRGALD